MQQGPTGHYSRVDNPIVNGFNGVSLSYLAQIPGWGRGAGDLSGLIAG